MSEITIGQVQPFTSRCSDCGEPPSSCVCDEATDCCDVCGDCSQPVRWCPYCMCGHCEGCPLIEDCTACPRESEKHVEEV